MIRILITGGAGYLGSTLVPRLLNLNYEVTVLDNFMYSQTPFNAHIMNPDLWVINGDACNFKDVIEHVANHDYFIPLAALVGMPLCNKRRLEAEAINHFAVRNIAIEIARQKLDTRVIIPITNSGYGIGEKGKECTEETPMRPISHYGHTKVGAENSLKHHIPNQFVSLRLATVFGASPRMRLDLLVNEFVYRAYHDHAITLFEADFMRNYIHIRDVVGAFLFAINNFDDMRGNIFNVGDTAANMSKRQLCERIKLQLPQFVYNEAATGTDPDKRDYFVSNAKIEALGWRPEVSLDEGIAELINLYGHLKVPNPYGNV